METYFFHLDFVDKLVPDQEGTSLTDVETAKAEARQIIRDLAADHLRGLRPLLLWKVCICNDRDELLAEVHTSEALHEVIPVKLLLAQAHDTSTNEHSASSAG
jgi:hypothetical protein